MEKEAFLSTRSPFCTLNYTSFPLIGPNSKKTAQIHIICSKPRNLAISGFRGPCPTCICIHKKKRCCGNTTRMFFIQPSVRWICIFICPREERIYPMQIKHLMSFLSSSWMGPRGTETNGSECALSLFLLSTIFSCILYQRSMSGYIDNELSPREFHLLPAHNSSLRIISWRKAIFLVGRRPSEQHCHGNSSSALGTTPKNSSQELDMQDSGSCTHYCLQSRQRFYKELVFSYLFAVGKHSDLDCRN